MLTLSSRAATSVAISFLPCVPSSLSGPITSPTPPLIKNKKTVLDESVSREGGGGETAGLHRPVLHVGSWSEGGAEGGNFLGSDVWLNPDGGRRGGGAISGCSAGPWPQLQQRLV